ncbi:unnamed protein product [Orchesella dallaii]|uniref:Uncharacterized protein n=1 Tax=Orchesella dallaii TaxID=48710 RepID=A0ABP1PUB4_9HEXA
MFDPRSGKQEQEIKIKPGAKIIALSREEYPGSTDRTLAILDKNNDLSIMVVKKYGSPSESKLLATMISTIMWHREAPMLACIKDGMLRIYYYPHILYLDTTLLDFTWEDRETISDLGRAPEILAFDSNRISIRKADGVLVVGTGAAFMSHIHRHANIGKFSEAKRICNYVNSKFAWGVTAGLAALKQELSIAEKCYSELGLHDKVLFIQDIKANSQDEPTRRSLLSILSGNMQDVENILLQNGRFQHAVELNMTCCNWERALELALQHNVLVESVLKGRKEYLADLKNQSEKIQLFIDTEKKLGTSTKKKTKVVAKKREKSAPSMESEEFNTSGSGDFSLQPNPMSLTSKVGKEPDSISGITEETNEDQQQMMESFALSRPPLKAASDKGGQNTAEEEKELQVDDFY